MIASVVAKRNALTLVLCSNLSAGLSRYIRLIAPSFIPQVIEGSIVHFMCALLPHIDFISRVLIVKSLNILRKRCNRLGIADYFIKIMKQDHLKEFVFVSMDVEFFPCSLTPLTNTMPQEAFGSQTNNTGFNDSILTL